MTKAKTTNTKMTNELPIEKWRNAALNGALKEANLWETLGILVCVEGYDFLERLVLKDAVATTPPSSAEQQAARILAVRPAATSLDVVRAYRRAVERLTPATCDHHIEAMQALRAARDQLLRSASARIAAEWVSSWARSGS